jgi:hypothetical protein
MREEQADTLVIVASWALRHASIWAAPSGPICWSTMMCYYLGFTNAG